MKKPFWFLYLFILLFSAPAMGQKPCDVYIVPSWNVNTTSLTVVDSASTFVPVCVWNTGETTPGINAPTSGEYCVTATFPSGCTATACYTVNQTCTTIVYYDFPSSNVTIHSLASPFYIPVASYKWSNGATTQNIENVGPGTYCVTTTLASGCKSSACIEVLPTCQLSINQVGNQLVASSNPGGVTPNYTWSTGATTASISPNTSGTYCVTLTTSLGCHESKCIYFTKFEPSCPVVLENNGGTISVKPNGAVPTAYQWSTGETTATISPNINAEVCVTVTYGNCTNSGCTYAYNPNSCSVGLTLDSYPDSVSGQINFLNAVVVGNAYDWSYDWGIPQWGEAYRRVEAAGEYCVTVTNKITNCSATQCFWVQTNGACKATLTAAAIDYVDYQLSVSTTPDPIQSISWTHGPSNSQITVNEAGVYQANVTTTAGCTVSASVRLFDNSRLLVASSMGSDSANYGNQSTEFFLIKYDPAQGGILTAVDRVDNYSSSSLGSTLGQFNKVQPGEYLVKAALKPQSKFYQDFLPTYFEQSALWSGATPVVVRKLSLDSYIQQASIKLIKGQNPGGPGFISGKVLEGANLTGGGVVESEGDPMPNISIVLTKSDGTPLLYAKTDAQGKYNFPSLPYGTYIVWLDVPGLKPASIVVTLSPNKPKMEGRDFKMDHNSAVSSTSDADLLQSVRVYPNPTSDLLWVDLRTEAQVSLSNAQGQTVQQINAAIGTTSISTAHLPAGIYLLSVRKNDAVETFKILKK